MACEFFSVCYSAPRYAQQENLAERHMVVRGTPLPRRIAPDAIIEVLLELRFDAVSPLPEVLFGRFAELPAWRGFKQLSLPAYQVPVAFRENDPTLRFTPVFELTGVNPARAIRIGPHVLSYHRLAPYAGWDDFNAGLDIAIDSLFEKTYGLVVNRIGLRYINAFTRAGHGIDSVLDLDLQITVAGERLGGNLNLNFTIDVAEQTQCRVSVATRDYFAGVVPADTVLLADVDVFTVAGYSSASKDAVKQWVAAAHRHKNEAFFCLLTEGALARLRRDDL